MALLYSRAKIDTEAKNQKKKRKTDDVAQRCCCSVGAVNASWHFFDDLSRIRKYDQLSSPVASGDVLRFALFIYFAPRCHQTRRGARTGATKKQSWRSVRNHEIQFQPNAT